MVVYAEMHQGPDDECVISNHVLGLRRDVLSRGLRRDRPLPVVRCERRTERERESLAIGMVRN